MKPAVFVLAGPTASGKTALALKLAERFPMEIVNADTLQVFRRLDIGTAKPSKEVRKNVPHHLVDLLDPDEGITAAWYADEGGRAIESILKRKRIPLLVGGAGFYLKALERPPVKEIDFAQTELADLASAYEEIAKHDPVTAKRIHPNDRYRISRAVGLIRRGILPSETWDKAEAQESSFQFHWFGIDWERKSLHERIEERVQAIYQSGLVEETSSVMKDFPSALGRLSKAIGYHEALEHVKGKYSLTEAIQKTCEATRQYAKRQMTWFRGIKTMEWLPPDSAFDKASEIVEKGSIS